MTLRLLVLFALAGRTLRKFHWAREGAAGGDGMAAGGGCGCGT